METPPTINPTPTWWEKASKPPQLYGVVFLALIGCASFVFVFSYLSALNQTPATETAAAAAPVDAFLGMNLEAKSAIVYDLSTGKTLYEKNADTQLPLASITKVMLMLAVHEVLPPNTVITIPYDTSPVGSAEHLGKGQQWKLQDVINFTLIASSNDGADILAAAANSAIHNAYPAAPVESATLWRMNDIARQLGMQHTYFLNDNGLDISTTQSGAYSSARDVATMMAYAATSSPETFAGTAEDGLRLKDEAGDTTAAINTNEALGDIPGLVMGKTGFTDLAGGNLAVVFDVGLAHPVVAVVMGSSQAGRFTDMKSLVAHARAAVMQE